LRVLQSSLYLQIYFTVFTSSR